jgi:hypothetical protein
MALTNFKNHQVESSFDTNLCSVPGCSNWWSVKIDKPMCSHHQWANTEKPKPAPILANYPKKVKTVSTWYDEVEF